MDSLPFDRYDLNSSTVALRGGETDACRLEKQACKLYVTGLIPGWTERFWPIKVNELSQHLSSTSAVVGRPYLINEIVLLQHASEQICTNVERVHVVMVPRKKMCT